MDLRQLEMLLAVAECGGFQQAGTKLHVSHSAVHRQVRLLEAELHDHLLIRKGRNVVLTPTGRMVVDGARRVQLELRRVQLQVQETQRLDAGQLRIGTGTTTLIYFLSDILESFRTKYPGVDVRVTTGTGDVIVQGVREGLLDIAVVYAPRDTPDGASALSYEVLYEDEFVLAVSSRHPLANRKTVALERVAEFPVILYPPSSHLRRHFDRLFMQHGLAPRVIMELENEEAMERMIAIGMGIAFFSKRREQGHGIHRLRLRGQTLSCNVGLVYPAGDYLSHATREFARMCREVAN